MLQDFKENEIIDDIITINITSENSKTRIDKVISEELKDITRSRVQKLIEDGHVCINTNNNISSSFKCKEGDIITINMPEPEKCEIEAENIDINIIYEDDDIIIVNKAQGMVVHPSAGHYSGTLVNALMYRYGDGLSEINGEIRPGIVHRIDKDTSGILVICRNNNSHNYISSLLSVHDITRKYYCLCNGIFKDKEGTVDAPIGRSNNDRKKMSINPNGRNAVTHYKVIAEFKNKYSLVECILETGRTHQIRVHLSSIHHPIVGDPVYNNHKSEFKTNGQLLHAAVLGFIHPTTSKYIEFRAVLPDYFYKILNSFNESKEEIADLQNYLSKSINLTTIY